VHADFTGFREFVAQLIKIEGEGALVNPDEKLQYRKKRHVPFRKICGVPKDFK
jgi:hypothetical protein